MTYNRELDASQRFNPNYELGNDFEDYFAAITKNLKGMNRATNKMSYWDFRYYSILIELKQRRYTFETFDSYVITQDKYNKLKEAKSALYINRFDNGQMYYCNLTAIKNPLEENTYRASTGYTVKNYLIPSTLFNPISENGITTLLKSEAKRIYG